MAGRTIGSFAEFFCGGGMARAGLGRDWRCVFANDLDRKKAETYRANWGGDALRVKDVAEVTLADFQAPPDLAWASFPCQDLSVAGGGAGLMGDRSGAFWPFWRVVTQMRQAWGRPKLVVLENVIGALTSHGGRDFTAIVEAMARDGYRVGAMVIDAVHFVPQSRPRLFIIGAANALSLPAGIASSEPPAETPRSIRAAFHALPAALRAHWIWWRLPPPPRRNTSLADILEPDHALAWRDPAETDRLIAMMSPANRRKLAEAQDADRRVVGTLYRRTRRDEAGGSVQRAEVRFDGIAGCLRTPAGGSSRQTVLVVDGDRVKSRLITAREAARLMGLADTYQLPTRFNDAYRLLGDGVAAPVAAWLSTHLLIPIAPTLRPLAA